MDVSGSILANLDAGYPCRHDEDLRILSPLAVLRINSVEGTPSSQRPRPSHRFLFFKFYLGGLCVFAGDIPIL
jgi:hypothetical protein